MKINWLLRLKNKTTLTALVVAVIALVYQVLGVIGVVPYISESEITEIAGVAINLLVMLGIVTDPTTTGVSDSNRAMRYEDPRNDNN